MKEYRKTTPQGELIYKLSDTASGKMKLETVYPNGYVYETPYELDEFHLMTWGYVEVSNLCLRFNADETGELWSCLQGSVPFTENGKIGCRKGGEVVFPATADQIEFVEGGTLYLGVNDSGGINGLDTDLEALPKKTHSAYKGIDGYVRYITDRAREYFDLDVRIHFHIEPAYDNKVVAIRVDPYEHGVVEFEGIPYIRNNSESVKMSQTLRRQIETKRISQMQDKPAKNVVALTEAIKEEQRVILHGYSSSSSGEVKQYTVEPFAFMGNYAYLWAWDVQAEANKVFRISCIGNVQVTRDPWTAKARHKRGQADIFHFTGEKAIPVKLELDLLAKNLLVEEYPEAAGELKPIGATSGTPDCFLLQTNVYSMLGLGRFYAGLAPHIRILDAPGLAAYARDYFQNALKELK